MTKECYALLIISDPAVVVYHVIPASKPAIHLERGNGFIHFFFAFFREIKGHNLFLVLSNFSHYIRSPFKFARLFGLS